MWGEGILSDSQINAWHTDGQSSRAGMEVRSGLPEVTTPLKRDPSPLRSWSGPLHTALWYEQDHQSTSQLWKIRSDPLKRPSGQRGLENRTPTFQKEVSIQMGSRSGKGQDLGRERLEFSGITVWVYIPHCSSNSSPCFNPPSPESHPFAFPLSHLPIPLCSCLLSKVCVSFLSDSEGLSFPSFDWHSPGCSICTSNPSAGSLSERTASAPSHSIPASRKGSTLYPLEQAKLSLNLPNSTVLSK